MESIGDLSHNVTSDLWVLQGWCDVCPEVAVLTNHTQAQDLTLQRC